MGSYGIFREAIFIVCLRS